MKLSKKKIIVIGFGDLGTALVHLVGNKGYNINVLTSDTRKIESLRFEGRNLYCKKLSDIDLPTERISIYPYEDAKEIISSSDIIIITVPSGAIPETLELIKQNIKRTQKIIIVLTSKGADTESGKTPYALAREIFRGYRSSIVMLSVVGFARGIANREVTKALVSAKRTNIKDIRIIQALLKTRYFVPEISFNPESACSCGLLKNAFAIIIGICEKKKDYTYYDGQRVTIGENTRAALIDECSKEMLNIGKIRNIKKSMVEGLVGMIDLELSCSLEGRNYRCGRFLAQGKTLEYIISELGTIEGIGATRYLAKVAPDSKYIQTLNRLFNEEITLNEGIGIILNDKKFKP